MLKGGIIISVLLLLCCTQPAPNPVNLVFLIDCSSSVSADSELIKKDLVDVGTWWAEQATNNGGTFEILIIGTGIDDVTSLGSWECPTSFTSPIFESKKKWITDLERELKDLGNRLPSEKGSGIIEGIFRASNRLSEFPGEKILIIRSDLREVNADFNFEHSVPSNATLVENWLKEHHLTPSLTGTRVFITGFKPYPPNSTTPRISSTEYGKLRNLWLALFEHWGVKVRLGETLNIKSLKGGDSSESQNQ